MSDTRGRVIEAAEIERWLIETASRELQLAPSEIDPQKRLTSHGLDSLQLIALIGLLEDRLGCRFTSNPLALHPSIAVLSAFLADNLNRGITEIDPGP